jgi:hypothetical protein
VADASSIVPGTRVSSIGSPRGNAQERPLATGSFWAGSGLMSGGVSVPPLLVLFGLLAGEELAGVAGIFLSVPVLAAAKIATLRIAQQLRSPVPSESVEKTIK